jgi:hypothetical protein
MFVLLVGGNSSTEVINDEGLAIAVMEQITETVGKRKQLVSGATKIDLARSTSMQLGGTYPHPLHGVIWRSPLNSINLNSIKKMPIITMTVRQDKLGKA